MRRGQWTMDNGRQRADRGSRTIQRLGGMLLAPNRARLCPIMGGDPQRSQCSIRRERWGRERQVDDAKDANAPDGRQRQGSKRETPSGPSGTTLKEARCGVTIPGGPATVLDLFSVDTSDLHRANALFCLVIAGSRDRERHFHCWMISLPR